MYQFHMFLKYLSTMSRCNKSGIKILQKTKKSDRSRTTCCSFPNQIKGMSCARHIMSYNALLTKNSLVSVILPTHLQHYRMTVQGIFRDSYKHNGLHLYCCSSVVVDDDHSHHICWAATCVLWWLINPILARKRRPHVGQEMDAVPSGGFWIRSFLT